MLDAVVMWCRPPLAPEKLFCCVSEHLCLLFWIYFSAISVSAVPLSYIICLRALVFLLFCCLLCDEPASSLFLSFFCSSYLASLPLPAMLLSLLTVAPVLLLCPLPPCWPPVLPLTHYSLGLPVCFFVPVPITWGRKGSRAGLKFTLMRTPERVLSWRMPDVTWTCPVHPWTLLNPLDPAEIPDGLSLSEECLFILLLSRWEEEWTCMGFCPLLPSRLLVRSGGSQTSHVRSFSYLALLSIRCFTPSFVATSKIFF